MSRGNEKILSFPTLWVTAGVVGAEKGKLKPKTPGKYYRLMPDLHSMIDGCKKADRRCQEQLYRHCYAEMMGVCLRYTGHEEEAAAAYNEAMLKVFNHIPRYADTGPFMGWVQRIMVTTCIDHYRRRQRFEPEQSGHPGLTVAESDAGFEPEAYRQMDAREVMRLIHRLPPKMALVFNMYVFEGFTHEAIAGHTGIPAGTSKWLLSEARRKLKNLLQNKDTKEVYQHANR